MRPIFPPAPTVADCLQLMADYRMLDNIKAHSLLVAEVAKLIARGLVAAGLEISIETVVAGALLHDIGKTACLQTGENHAVIGEKICLDQHLPAVAEIVRQHIVLHNFDRDGQVSEKEIVYYADKRVKHDRVVDLEERKAYVIDRYAHNDARRVLAIERNFVRCQAVEQKLFTPLSFAPADLAELIAVPSAAA